MTRKNLISFLLISMFNKEKYGTGGDTNYLNSLSEAFLKKKLKNSLSCLNSLSEAFLKKKFQNSWSIQRGIFIVESDLSKATPVTLL